MNRYFLKKPSALLSGVLLSLLFLLSCVQAPTKIYGREEYYNPLLQKKFREPIKVTDETVVLDARTPFEYAVAHLPQAINLEWTAFVTPAPVPSGILKTDLQSEIRRLAIYGINPTTPVLIVGHGIQGGGEEGRLAWTLLYLGIRNVQTSSIDSLGMRYSNIVSPPRQNSTPWKPNFQHAILADRREIVHISANIKNENIHVIDVRSKNEFFSKNYNLEYETPDIRAIHIDWREFFNQQGRPNESIRKQLAAINIKEGDRIITISNRGLRSGAVAYALLALGFQKVANYAGGYTELLGNKKGALEH